MYFIIVRVQYNTVNKLLDILTYYDSEPAEIVQGFIWLFIFPIIYTLEHGFNPIIFLSIILGFCSIYAVINLTLRIRKTLSYAIYFFSIIALLLFFSKGDYVQPTHWIWFLISLNALLNLKTITNRYYIKKCRKKIEDERLR